MKVKNFLLGGLVVAMMGFIATGCNENPTDPIDSTAPTAPSDLQATSLSDTEVGLKWKASTDTGVITYKVSWREKGTTTDAGTADVTGGAVSKTVQGLTAGKVYVFDVQSVRDSKTSSKVSVEWAGAKRSGRTVAIRMYEKASSNPSGLMLNGSSGAEAVSVATSSSTPPSSVHLVVYADPAKPNQVEIGPGKAFTEYANVDKFNQNVFVSDSSWPALTMDSWYPSGSLAARIPSDGDIRAFTFPASQVDGTGQGFYVRLGTVGNYNYARVFVRNVGGRLLQGTSPNRYIEVEVSYQTAPNVEFAKPAGGYTRANIGSTRGH